MKPKELRAWLGREDDLPSVAEVLSRTDHLTQPRSYSVDPVLEQRRANLVARQRKDRAALLIAQEARRIEELKARREWLPRGLKAAFLRVTGRYQRLVRECETAVQASLRRDRAEQQKLIETHLAERRALSRELRRAGLTEAFRSGVANDPRQTLAPPSEDPPLSRAQLLWKPALILEHVSKTKARFDRTDVLRALAKRIDDPFALKDAADWAMTSPDLIRLEENGTCFTTRDYRDAEIRLERSVLRMTDTGGFGVARQHITRAVGVQDAQMQRTVGGRLSGEQRAALDHILGGRKFACVVGLAGAGKSTMLATAMEAWRRQGVAVHGAALAGKAADGLESASGIQSRTLASLETSWENGYEPIGKGDVLVVDEAGMIATRQMARIASKIEEIGAKLVLVSDPDQLQPIEAGRPFRDVVAACGAARLMDIHRQREDWQQASRSLAEGRLAEAVDAYAKRGGVTRGTTRDDVLEALVEAYTMDVAADRAGATRLAFAHRRRDVHALNQAIRAALRSVEDPVSEVLLDTETGPRAFAAGDRIVFGKNDRELGVKNGILGTVDRSNVSELIVTLDGDPPRRVTFDPRRYRSFDHGYAVTIHKSQGATVDQSHVLASRSMDRHLAYVAMTRHRDAMRLYVSDRDRPKWAQTQRHEAFGRGPPQRSGPSMG